MVVYTLNWCNSTSAVHGWFWLKLLKCIVQFSLVPRFSVGGKKESLVSTVCAALNFSEILGDRELSRCISTTVTFITCTYYYTAHTFSDQWWSSFDWGRDSHLSDAAFSGYFLWTIFLSPHHSLFLETVSTGNFKGGARSAPVPLLPLWLHVCTRTHS